MATTIWSGAVSGDWSVAGNWSAGVPGNGDDAILRDNAVDVDAGLNQAAVTLASLTIEQSYTGLIGTATAYLQIGSILVDIGEHPGYGTPAGSGRIKLDLSSAKTTVTIHNSASTSADTNQQPIRLLVDQVGIDPSYVRVLKGKVGIAEDPTEVSAMDELHIGYQGSQATDADVSCGEGVTIDSFKQTGGNAELRSEPTIIEQHDGTLTVWGSAGITTATIYDGAFFPNNPGGIATLHPYGGTIDFTRSLAPRTVTNAPDFRPGATLVFDPAVITFTAGLAAAEPVTLMASEGV